MPRQRFQSFNFSSVSRKKTKNPIKSLVKRRKRNFTKNNEEDCAQKMTKRRSVTRLDKRRTRNIGYTHVTMSCTALLQMGVKPFPK